MNALSMHFVGIVLKVAVQTDLSYPSEDDGSKGGNVLLTTSSGDGKGRSNNMVGTYGERGFVISLASQYHGRVTEEGSLRNI